MKIHDNEVKICVVLLKWAQLQRTNAPVGTTCLIRTVVLSKMGIYEAVSSLMIFTIMCAMIYNIECYNLSDVKRLLKDKRVDYDKKLRPVLNQSDTLHIHVAFELSTIQEFNEVLERFSAVGILSLSWKDESMAWDPDDYDGVDSLVTESGDFWMPNLILTNSFEKFEKLGADWYIVRYTPDGMAVLYPGSVFAAICAADFTFYPWDTQNCVFAFNAWGFGPKEVRFESTYDKVLTNYYYGNGVWDLSGSMVHTMVEDSVFVIVMTITRKPQFFIVNVILPIVSMACLNVAVFMIPTESGERMSYCLSALLAIAVFLTLVGDNLPKTSTSILSYYLLSILIASICITFSTICSLMVYFRDDDTPVPSCLSSLVRCLRCQRRRRTSASNTKSANNIYNRTDIVKDSTLTNNGPFIINKHINATALKRNSSTRGFYSYKNCSARHGQRSVANNYYRRHQTDTDNIETGRKQVVESTYIDTQESAGEKKLSWKDVSVAMDKLFFMIFTILFLTDTIIAGLMMTQRILV